jgi:acetyltransferase-like isoleucine patch superfamily enzyme
MGVEVRPAAESFRVEYAQFRRAPLLHGMRAVCGVLSWPLVWPLAMLCRASDILFRTVSEALSIVPYAFGVVLRGAFYRFALRECGSNVIIEFGAIFLYRDITIGSNVLVGRYNIVHLCDFGDYVLTGERCTFLSGGQYHRHDRADVPMALQGGNLRRTRVESDCWIGSHSVIMSDVALGAIVGAASVVTRPVEPYTIVAGNPARFLRMRGQSETARAASRA